MNASFLDFRLLLLLILVLPMGFVTLLLAARAWRDQQRVNAARGWESVTGKVISASVERVSLPVRVQTSTNAYRWAVRYAPALVYEYIVNGRLYHGSRLRLGARLASSDASSAEREIARYSVGGQVIVWYDPANPADSTLERGIHWAVWTQWLVSGIMLILTVAMVFLIFS